MQPLPHCTRKALYARERISVQISRRHTRLGKSIISTFWFLFLRFEFLSPLISPQRPLSGSMRLFSALLALQVLSSVHVRDCPTLAEAGENGVALIHRHCTTTSSPTRSDVSWRNYRPIRSWRVSDDARSDVRTPSAHDASALRRHRRVTHVSLLSSFY